MRRVLHLFVVSAAVLSPLACGGGSGEEASAGGDETSVVTDEVPADAPDTVSVDGAEEDTPVSEQAQPELPELYLEQFYATSINMPEEMYGPENVFDGDTATYWATMPGAAPDEGIYFSFEEPVSIENIRIETVPGGEDFGYISMVRYYFNGVEGSLRRPTSTVYTDGPVKSVFIKIVETLSMDDHEQGIRYRKDVPVAISEVIVWVSGEDGALRRVRIVPMARAQGTIAASSSLEPVEAYSPDYLFDSRIAFGWADGNTDESGEGERLTFTFDEPQTVETLKIWNGYHRSRVHFDSNERASLISFGTAESSSAEYQLDDTMEPQIIYLDRPLQGREFLMEFLEVIPGDAYRDLVLSEMRFFDGSRWMVMDTGNYDEVKREILQWADGCHAGTFMDRQISSHWVDAYNNAYYDRSLVIRSNGSFVLWKEDDVPAGGDERVYADGNWQILTDSSIRIFGRLHRLADYGGEGSRDPYAGTWSDQNERLDRMTIFSDTLRFGPDRIASSRGLFEEMTF